MLATEQNLPPVLQILAVATLTLEDFKDSRPVGLLYCFWEDPALQNKAFMNVKST